MHEKIGKTYMLEYKYILLETFSNMIILKYRYVNSEYI